MATKRLMSLLREKRILDITLLIWRRFISFVEFQISAILGSKQKSIPTNYKPLVAKKRKVVFLYDELNKDKGSTVLRSQQLFEVTKTSDQLDILRTNSPDQLKNSIVILDKYSSLFLPISKLEKLRKNGNFIVADPVDDIINTYRLQYIDGLMAAALKQHKHFQNNFSHKYLGYIFHHSDIRIMSPQPSQKLRPAYFGELRNMYRFSGDENIVDIFGINTSSSKISWMEAIGTYSLHYAVRPPSGPSEIFKPFTKGIIAAHVGANIIVHKDDGDALEHLTDNYPYLIKGELTPESAKMTVEDAINSRNGQDWNRGLEMMKELKETTSITKLRKVFENYILKI